MPVPHSVSVYHVESLVVPRISENLASGATEKDKGSAKVRKIHPLETINIFKMFHGTLFNSFWDISARTKVVDQPQSNVTYCVFLVLGLGSLAVARELHGRGLNHCWAERQLQFFVDHQSTQQRQPNGNVGLRWGIPHNCVLVCAKVCRDKIFQITCKNVFNI